MKLLPLLLLVGCVAPDGAFVGAGHIPGTTDFVFDEQPGGERIEYDEEDATVFFGGFTWDFAQSADTTVQTRPSPFHAGRSGPASPAGTSGEKPGNNNLKVFGMEIPTDTNPLLVLAVAALLWVGGKFGYRKIRDRRNNGKEEKGRPTSAKAKT